MKYAVITTERYTVPGDERSRTHPGHGYPEHDVSYSSITEFESQDALKSWIRNHKDTKYRVIEFQELEVKTELLVELKRPGVTRSR